MFVIQLRGDGFPKIEKKTILEICPKNVGFRKNKRSSKKEEILSISSF